MRSGIAQQCCSTRFITNHNIFPQVIRRIQVTFDFQNVIYKQYVTPSADLKLRTKTLFDVLRSRMARLLFYSALIILVLLSTILMDDLAAAYSGVYDDSSSRKKCPEGQVLVRGRCIDINIISGKQKRFL
jgi:hypothetical protein